MTALHVVSYTLGAQQDVAAALRRLRHMRSEGFTLLLFADLPPCAARRHPDDEALIRALQSGVMAMAARHPGQFLLLVRARAWNDAARMYLGAGQALGVRQVVAQLIESGQTQAAFEAATLSSASFKDRFSVVLFSDLSLACTPDTPERMRAALAGEKDGWLCADVRCTRAYPHSVLSRLVRACSFALTPLHAAQDAWLRSENKARTDGPVICTAEALVAAQHAPIQTAPLAQGCFFVREDAPALHAYFAAHRQRTLRHAGADAYLPLVQLALLFFSAVFGWPLPAACAALPEALCALKPRLLPGALLRAALLPLTAAVSLDALLCRALACSRLLRLRVPPFFLSAQGGMLAGGALLALALRSAGALVVLLPLALLWLSLPLLLPALHHPTLERIPLSEDERAAMRTLAESAYFAGEKDASAPPALHMLAACAGSMLGVLEPDEAARQAASLLADDPQATTACEQAAFLASAQYLREQMDKCDAALRELPAQIEAHARALPPSQAGSPLGLFLRIARSGKAAPEAPALLRSAPSGAPLDALFLPLRSVKETARRPLTLPLTHPHTFLKQRLLASPSEAPEHALSLFLSLSAAVLDHPFHALLGRSPVTGPYAALLTI